jgi:hypothetical protein
VQLDRALVAMVEEGRSAPAAAPAAVAAPVVPAPSPAAARPGEAAAPDGNATARPAALRARPSSLSITVPFGEQPLSGDRVGAVRSALDELRRTNFRGDVELQVFQGRFCLVGNPAEGFSLAPDDLAYSRCDRVGNLSQDGGASRESTAFANMLAEERKAAGAAIGIRIADGGERPVQPYPEAAPTLNAGSWNASAAANNRVEMRWRERP